MKYCTKCGNVMSDNDYVCSKCGYVIDNEIVRNPNNYGYVNRKVYSSSRSNTLYTVAGAFGIVAMAVYLIISVIYFSMSSMPVDQLIPLYGEQVAALWHTSCIVLAVIVLLPLIWIIPMTIKIFKCSKNGEVVSLGFKICSLIFINPISGILLLCDSGNK